jgi:hypothetical protein
MYREMKAASKLLNLPFEYYVVIFLFVVVILMSVYGNGADYAPFRINTSLSPYQYEGFKSEFPQKVHNASSVSGQEVPVLQGNKGVLGIFEAEGLKAAPVDSPSLHDPISKLKGSTDCVGQSPYSNSLGGLCITEEAKKTFCSRGGNHQC